MAVKIVKGQSFIGKTPTPADIYIGCNFSARGKMGASGKWEPDPLNIPGTPVFLECNLTNRLPPKGSIVLRCNTSLVQRDQDVPGDASKLKHTVWGNVHPDTLAVMYKAKTLDIVKDRPAE